MRRTWAVIFTAIAVGAVALSWFVRSRPVPKPPAPAQAQAQAQAAPGMKVPPPLPPCDTFEALTPDDAFKGGEKSENKCVRWTLPLKAIRGAGGTAMVYLAAGADDPRMIAIIAEPAAFPGLKASKPGDPIQVQGRVTWVQGAQIALHETTLAFPGQSH
jgi:hypothetical protein